MLCLPEILKLTESVKGKEKLKLKKDLAWEVKDQVVLLIYEDNNPQKILIYDLISTNILVVKNYRTDYMVNQDIMIHLLVLLKRLRLPFESIAENILMES